MPRSLGSGRGLGVYVTRLFLPISAAICSQPSPPQGPGKEDEELEVMLLSVLLPHTWSWEETRPSFGLGIR